MGQAADGRQSNGKDGFFSVAKQASALLFLMLTGCYAAGEPVHPDDAFRIDAAPQPDATQDAFAPDAAVPPDAGQPDLGADCSLGGTQNAFSFTGGMIPPGTRSREVSANSWLARVVPFDWAEGGTGQSIVIVPPSAVFVFRAPEPSGFTPGEYRNTETTPTAHGTTGVSIPRRACPSGGTLTIHEVVVTDGELRRFRASYEESCSGSPPFVGCIRYTAP